MDRRSYSRVLVEWSEVKWSPPKHSRSRIEKLYGEGCAYNLPDAANNSEKETSNPCRQGTVTAGCAIPIPQDRRHSHPPLLSHATIPSSLRAWKAMDKVTRGEESKSSRIESFLKTLKLETQMIKEEEDEEQRFRDEIPEPPPATAFKPEKFGDGAGLDKLSKSLSQYALVSVALFNGDVLLYACSGIAIELRTSDNEILHGFLGLYDEKNGIATVTSLSLEVVCTMDTSDPVDLPQGTLGNTLFAFGCATDGTLLGANCSRPVVKNQALVSVNCEITESGYGGPVMYFAPGGSAHLAGLIVRSDKGKITLLPAKKLHNRLKCFLKITSKASHFRGYSLPKGLQTVIPSGFMVEAKILQSLGYPLPPPLLFELNGRLTGRFEEHFGQLHYWEGYPFDFSYNYGENPIWDQLGERLTQQISQSVVSIASFKDNKRCFACTSLLITGKHCPFVLTSASLVRTGDADGKIDENLRIDVFLPRNHTVQGTLKLYHQNYNIAIVHLQQNLGIDTSPQDILNVRESIGRPSIGRAVVAIGRATKGCHGLLMASMGKVKGKYKAVTEGKSKQCTGLAKKLDCQELLLSTCQIKKVGIGGPLIGLDGSFIGMNFYDESRTTPFLPRKEILTVLREGFDLLESRPVNMEDIRGHLSSNKTLKRKRNQWPVPEPYWFLAGQVDPLDQLVGKVLM